MSAETFTVQCSTLAHLKKDHNPGQFSIRNNRLIGVFVGFPDQPDGIADLQAGLYHNVFMNYGGPLVRDFYNHFMGITSTPETRSDYNFEYVIVYENGHALSLDHNINLKSVMHAGNYDGLPKLLDRTDIQGVCTDIATPTPTATPTPVPTATVRPSNRTYLPLAVTSNAENRSLQDKRGAGEYFQNDIKVNPDLSLAP